MISIVTTAYEPEYLEEAIESVLIQDVDLEQIIVDDGSKNTLVRDIVKKFGDKRIKVINSEHIGAASALNLGLINSKGDKITILDSDDVLLPRSLEKRSEFLDKNPEYCCVSGGVVYIDKVGREYKVIIPKKQRNQTEMISEITREITNSLFHSSMMYRKSVFDNFGYYNKQLEVSYDKEFAFRILQGAIIGELLEPVVKYRTHSNNLSRIKRKAIIKDFDIIYDRYIENGTYRVYLKLQKRLMNTLKMAYQQMTPKR